MCMANLRSQSAGLNLYATEHKGNTPWAIENNRRIYHGNYQSNAIYAYACMQRFLSSSPPGNPQWKGASVHWNPGYITEPAAADVRRKRTWTTEAPPGPADNPSATTTCDLTPARLRTIRTTSTFSNTFTGSGGTPSPPCPTITPGTTGRNISIWRWTTKRLRD